MRHGHVGTEHLLLGLLRDDAGVAGGAGVGEVLARAGLTPDRVRAEIGRHVGTAPDPFDADAEAALESIGIDLRLIRSRLEEAFGPDALAHAGPVSRRGVLRRRRLGPGRPFTPRAKKVLELALREARHLGSDHIGPEHIMLGIIRDGGGLAARILADAGLNLASLRRDIIGGLGRAA